MASNNLIIKVDVVKNDKLLELIGELMSEYEELLTLIPEWNNIEARQAAEKIGDSLSKLMEIRQVKN